MLVAFACLYVSTTKSKRIKGIDVSFVESEMQEIKLADLDLDEVANG